MPMHRLPLRTPVLAVAGALALLGALPLPFAPAGAARAQAPAAAAPAAADSTRGAGPVLVDRVIAVVDEEPVLMSELEREIALYKLERSQGVDSLASADPVATRREVLDRLIESKLMIAAAREAEIEVDDAAVQEDVEANIAELVRHFGSQAALESELERSGMNLTDYRARTTAQLRDRRYMSAVVNRFVRSKIEVREDEVAAYYAAHKAEIGAAPDSLTLGSILVPVQPSEAAQRELQRKLGDVMQEMGAGRPFAEVAARHTEGPNRERGGSLGTLRRGDLDDRRLEEAVFALGAGETSRPIVTERGLHIMHVDSVEGDARVVSQIFFPIQITAADVAAASARADSAHARLLAGEAFAKVAAEVSAEPSAARGGDLGTFPVTDLSPRFQEALADRRPGQVTEPIQTPAGFYIFEVRARRPGRTPTYAEVRDSVRRAVESEKLQVDLARYVAGLRDRFYVQLKG
ncbi:MAG: peptidylprolyl isomerase [Candidatus Krumholzibacteriia bacterium]